MASAKVMPNSVASSRKQGHLALGKKKLEEFRKKKAAKQGISAGQLQSAEVDRSENHVEQYEIPYKNNQLKGDDYTSARDSMDVAKTSGLMMPNEDKTVNSSQDSDVNPSTSTYITSTSWNHDNHSSYGDSLQEVVKDKASTILENSSFSNLANGYYDHQRETNEFRGNEQTKVLSADGFKDQNISLGPNLDRPNVDESKSNLGLDSHVVQSGDIDSKKSSTSHMNNMNISGLSNRSILPEKLESRSPMLTFGDLSTSTSRHEVPQPFWASSTDNHGNFGRGRVADAISRHLNVDTSTWHSSESSSSGFISGHGSSSSGVSFPSTGYGMTFGHSRPSFLDSLSVSRSSLSDSDVSHGKPDTTATPVSSTKLQNTEAPMPSADNHMEQSVHLTTPDSIRENHLNTLISSNEQQLKQGARDLDIHSNYGFLSPKKDDFATLEQHIEDLTRENFSLQRALETAQTLSQSLASENSSLTDSFNQQGKVVNELKSDIQRFQEEIKAQMLALESVKMEYTNAQLECNAADERARLLASEVISLEEKALKLRSHELKLEKQLENLNSEIASYKRKVSVLEKECQDFQSTVDALQEEKKLLQSKLRKASTDVRTKHLMEHSSIKHDVSTSTDDLVAIDGEISIQRTIPSSFINTTQDAGPSVVLCNEMSSSSLLFDDRRIDLPDVSSDIPEDQQRMIQNIMALISELAVEKEELVQALRIESSNCSKLKNLNKDLSQKLEAQTQRLELLTSQRMASENVLAKPINAQSTNDTTTQYADEGDEVVERVLSWIMKLFPGGPAKRRTSKLL